MPVSLNCRRRQRAHDGAALEVAMYNTKREERMNTRLESTNESRGRPPHSTKVYCTGVDDGRVCVLCGLI